MRAILHLTVSDDIRIEADVPKEPAVVRKVEVTGQMEMNLCVTYEEFRRIVQNTAAASLGSLFDQAFRKFEEAEKTAVLQVQKERIAALEKVRAEEQKKLEAANATPAPAAEAPVAPSTQAKE